MRLLAAIVFLLDGLRNRLYERLKEIGVEIVRSPCMIRRSLETRSPCRPRAWEAAPAFPIRLSIELIENEVPELENLPASRSLDKRIFENSSRMISVTALGAGRKRKILGDVREIDEDLVHGPHGPVSAICQKLSCAPSP